MRAWEVKREATLGRRIHPIVRLTEKGVDWGSEPGPGDLIGYGMHPYRTDDCVQAAIATATQIPIEQVPDLGILRRARLRGEDPAEISETSWGRIETWAITRGLTLRFWEGLPLPQQRWIGVVVDDPDDGETEDHFLDHCLVLVRDRLLFDPACSVKPPPGMEPLSAGHFSLDQITYGFSLDKEE